MLERRFLSRVVVMAIAFIVGCSMILGTSTVEASAASKAPSKVTIYSYGSVNHNTVVVKWRAAKGAVAKYEVYRATSKNGKYKKVKTTKSKSFTNTGLTTGKNYYYKVRAVSKSGKKGKFSYKKVVKPMLNTQNLNIVGKGETYAKVSYNGVKGASGYQVYRAVKGGEYAKVGAYKETTVLNTGLKANTTYYYKVRAYKRVSGKIVYGAFSSAKAVTTNAHVHKWVQSSNDNTKTVYKCSGCSATNTHNHVWKIVEGKGIYKCDCGKTKACAHEWEPVFVEEGSITEDKCSICGITRPHECKWEVVKDGDEVICDSCVICGRTRDHVHDWVEQKEWVDPGTGHYEPDTKQYNVCSYCFEHNIWYAGEEVGKDEFYAHIDEHLFAGEKAGYKTAIKDSSFTNLTEEDLQVWVPDPKVEVVVGYKCSTCGATK